MTNENQHELTYAGSDDQEGWLATVDKVGGGTIGKTYAGENWIVSVYEPTGDFVVEDELVYMGMPKTHCDVARIAIEFAMDDRGQLALVGTHPR